MHSIRRSAALALLGSLLPPVLLPGQEREARLLDARTKYERGMADLMQRAEAKLRVLDVKAARRNEALTALNDKGDLERLEGMSELAAEAEERRQRLLKVFEESASAMVRHGEPGVDQILREQALWERIQDSLPWRKIELAEVEKREGVELVWQPPKETSGGYRLKVLGTVDPGKVTFVELVLPVAKPEFGIVRVPVVEGCFEAMVTVGPEGDVALDLGVVRGKDAFVRREAEGGEVRIAAAKPTLQLTELQWKPFVVRATAVGGDVVEAPPARGKASVEKSGDGDARKEAGRAPAAGAMAGAPPIRVWPPQTKVRGWRTDNQVPQRPETDCSIEGGVKSFEDGLLVFELLEKWNGNSPTRRWTWRLHAVDVRTGDLLFELVDVWAGGRVVGTNARGLARFDGKTMRGDYRVDFPGHPHPDAVKDHAWILDLAAAVAPAPAKASANDQAKHWPVGTKVAGRRDVASLEGTVVRSDENGLELELKERWVPTSGPRRGKTVGGTNRWTLRVVYVDPRDGAVVYVVEDARPVNGKKDTRNYRGFVTLRGNAMSGLYAFDFGNTKVPDVRQVWTLKIQP